MDSPSEPPSESQQYSNSQNYSYSYPENPSDSHPETQLQKTLGSSPNPTIEDGAPNGSSPKPEMPKFLVSENGLTNSTDRDFSGGEEETTSRKRRRSRWDPPPSESSNDGVGPGGVDNNSGTGGRKRKSKWADDEPKPVIQLPDFMKDFTGDESSLKHSHGDGAANLSHTFKYLFATQFLSRGIPFIFNSWIVRHLTEEEYAMYAVQFHLFVTCVLFLSREGFRRACMRAVIRWFCMYT